MKNYFCHLVMVEMGGINIEQDPVNNGKDNIHQLD